MKLELGKEYLFAGYKWVPVRINEEKQMAIMQSLGVTAGPWAGYTLSQFGDKHYYSQDISGKDISDYDEKTRALMKQIKPVISGNTGLYLPSYEDIEDNAVWKNALAKAAADYRSFGASYYGAWTGTYYGGSNAYYVNSNGNTYGVNQNNSFVVPAAFNLDLSKVEIEGDEIKVQVTKASGNPEISAQSLINKLRKQAEDSQKLLNLAADVIETYERAYNMTIKQTILKSGWNIECNVSSCFRYMIVHVGFINRDGNEDETSFDIKAYDVEELNQLYTDFCEENAQKKNTVTSINVVAVAETLEELEKFNM